MTQQTALQELIAWGDEMLLNHPQKLLSFSEVIDKAVSLLEKEKEQMFAYTKDKQVIGEYTDKFFTEEFEQYYNEKYKSK